MIATGADILFDAQINDDHHIVQGESFQVHLYCVVMINTYVHTYTCTHPYRYKHM